MEFSVIFPIIALVIGWLLNELSRYFITHYKKHDAIGQTLSSLLTVRSHMAIIQYYSNYITTKHAPSKLTVPEYKMLYRKFFPFNKEAYQNIQDSIVIIASSDPILASELRVNVLSADFFSKLSSIVEGDEREDKLFLDFISNLDDQLLPYIDEIILQLARKHGILTIFRAKHSLSKKIHLSKEAENSLTEFLQQLDETRKIE